MPIAPVDSAEQCKGCRMNRDLDVANVIELLLSDGSCIYLAASSLTECQEWLQSLCHAVSQQTSVSDRSGFKACLTPSRSRPR